MPISTIGESLQIICQDLGAQILGLKPSNLFYLSQLSAGDGKGLRGGQPVLFPQFADRGPLIKHGFARDLSWNLENSAVVNGMTTVRYTLNIEPSDLPEWPYAAKLTLEAVLGSDVLRQRFEVFNSGNEEFSWSGGLHPYFQVDDVTQTKLRGLHNVSYVDRYRPEAVFQGPYELGWDQMPCEKLFMNAPDLKLVSNTRTLILQVTGFDQWMVWNPGEVGARDINDLPNEDWNRFVCIEPVCVANPVVLKPEERFVGTLNVSW